MDKFEQQYIDAGFLNSFKKSLESWQECYNRMTMRREFVLKQIAKKIAVNPISGQDIDKWEDENNTRIPQDLKLFLTQIGSDSLHFPFTVDSGIWQWNNGFFLNNAKLKNLDTDEPINDPEYLSQLHNALIKPNNTPPNNPIIGSLCLLKSNNISFTNCHKNPLEFRLVVQGPNRGQMWVYQENELGYIIYPLKQAFKNTVKHNHTDFIGYLELLLNDELNNIHPDNLINVQELIDDHYKTLLFNDGIDLNKQDNETWQDIYDKLKYYPLPDVTDIKYFKNIESKIE
jgi:hypothetical protein